MKEFPPHLDILPRAQRQLWIELKQVPAEFTLYDGTAILDREGPVAVSFFGVPHLPRLVSPHVSDGNGLKIASLLDLAGTKASVIQVRPERKDYLDLDVLITKGGITLAMALSAAQAMYGASFNPQITLKALSYFDDGNLQQLPQDAKTRLATAARDVDF